MGAQYSASHPPPPRHPGKKKKNNPAPMRLSKGPTSALLLRLLRLGRSRTSLKSSLRSASMRGMVRAARSGQRGWSPQLLPAVQAARDASSWVCGEPGRLGRAGLRRAGAVPREREGGRLCRGGCSARAHAAPLRPRAAPSRSRPCPALRRLRPQRRRPR